MEFMANLSIIGLLKESPWPLGIPDIARVLRIDEVTACKALRLLRDAGRATVSTGGGWVIT